MMKDHGPNDGAGFVTMNMAWKWPRVNKGGGESTERRKMNFWKLSSPPGPSAPNSNSTRGRANLKVSGSKYNVQEGDKMRKGNRRVGVAIGKLRWRLCEWKMTSNNLLRKQNTMSNLREQRMIWPYSCMQKIGKWDKKGSAGADCGREATGTKCNVKGVDHGVRLKRAQRVRNWENYQWRWLGQTVMIKVLVHKVAQRPKEREACVAQMRLGYRGTKVYSYRVYWHGMSMEMRSLLTGICTRQK